MEKITITVNSYKDVSDGFHTIEELYDHRITLYIALCKHIIERGVLNVWRSKLHSDGSNYDGWFILGINQNKGEQISYHIPINRWDEISQAETLATAPEWDGHTSQDVLERLKQL